MKWLWHADVSVSVSSERWWGVVAVWSWTAGMDPTVSPSSTTATRSHPRSSSKTSSRPLKNTPSKWVQLDCHKDRILHHKPIGFCLTWRISLYTHTPILSSDFPFNTWTCWIVTEVHKLSVLKDIHGCALHSDSCFISRCSPGKLILIFIVWVSLGQSIQYSRLTSGGLEEKLPAKSVDRCHCMEVTYVILAWHSHLFTVQLPLLFTYVLKYHLPTVWTIEPSGKELQSDSMFWQ